MPDDARRRLPAAPSGLSNVSLNVAWPEMKKSSAQPG
jgi:hypothetical protein